MAKITHILSDEQLITELKKETETMSKVIDKKDVTIELQIESIEKLVKEKDNYKLQLQKLNEYQWICSMIIILLLVCTVTFGLMFSKSEQNNRVISTKIDEVFVKTMKHINWSDIVNQRFLNHSELEKILHSRHKMQSKINSDKQLRKEIILID